MKKIVLMDISTIKLGCLIMCFFSFFTVIHGSRSDKMKLHEIQVLTLKDNRMTTGRRSSPVPQLKCIENCNSRLPHVVQCTNKGWDGNTVQWECKGDLEDGVSFNDLAVICEGYDYPDDPYILTGSCGLEYGLRGYGSHGSNTQQQSYGWNSNVNSKPYKKTGFEFKDIFLFLVIGGILFALYKTCIANGNVDPTDQRSTTNGDYPPDDGRRPMGPGWNIPGMGGFTQGAGDGYASCGTPGRQQRGGGGGFWTGMATGGLMGYMFGNRNQGNGGYAQSYGRQGNYGSMGGSSFFSQSAPSSSFGSSSSSTRSSTGFAETRRR